MSETEKRKLIALGVLLLAVALSVNYWQGPVGLSASAQADALPSVGSPFAPQPQSKTVWTQRELPPQEPEPADERITYGTFLLTADNISEIPVKGGQSIEFSPVDNVAYDYYVNGHLQQHYPVYIAGSPQPMGHNIPYTYKAGFRLSPNQGRSEINFAYVIYLGNAPPAEWYSRALLASERK